MNDNPSTQENIMEWIALISGAISLVRNVEPVIEDLFKRGQITKEQADALRADYLSLKAHLHDPVTAPEWKQSGRLDPQTKLPLTPPDVEVIPPQ